MNNYIPRILEKKVMDYLKVFPVVGITGPRQSGKSTMLKNMFNEEFRYVTFDDYRYISQFNDDPEKFFSVYNDKVIFDEVQNVPNLFSYIKRAVDEDRRNGRFILTGSAQFSMLAFITESLAGRIGLLSLLPFQYKEILNSHISPSQFKGCYPSVVLNNYDESRSWYDSYLETYLVKDVRAISNIGDLSDFRRIIKMLASNCSQLLNYSHYSNALGISVPTVKRWISILEASYIIFLLPPYYKNFNKRITKSSKLYFYDTGLVSFLTGVHSQMVYEDGPLAGSIFENYIVSEIMKNLKHSGNFYDLYFYRANNTLEVDLLIDKGLSKDLIEIKSTSTFKPSMVKPLEKICQENDTGYLLYQGDEMPYVKNIKIWPYQKFLTV